MSIEWKPVMDEIVKIMNRDTPVDAKDIGSDGHETYSCRVCGEWWHGRKNYCCQCGQKIRYK